MRTFADYLALIAATLWVGGLWAIGYLAVPLLFSHLGDKQLAGMMAGRLFSALGYVGLISGIYLLLLRFARCGGSAVKQAFFWVLVTMLALTLAQLFGIQPLMNALKAQALPLDVMHSVFRDRFAAWHGISSIAYLLQSLLGLALLRLANSR
ncbi:MAG: DUF4149 domain-containing protein [Burkholderiales bacterium]